jgi:hypothetical protein
MRIENLHRDLDRWVAHFCPLLTSMGWNYHWSVDQAEYATDVTFHSQKALAQIYEPLIRLAIHAIRVEHVATFLGKRLNANFQNEAGNRFDVRLQGTRIKHTMGPVSIKMYDKFGLVLRMETTVNDLTFFQHYREVEQRDGQRVRKWAEMKKNIYSLPILQERLLAANWRYLQFLCALADPAVDLGPLHRITQTVQSNQRSYRGFNYFSAEDRSLFVTLLRGEYSIRGFANKDLKRHLPGENQWPAFTTPQTPPAPRSGSENPQILSLSPQSSRTCRYHARVQTQRPGDPTGTGYFCSPLKSCQKNTQN